MVKLATMGKIDTEKLKTAVDLRDLAGQHTTLRTWSAGELAGPCPKCIGEDRFHVKADWWFCNQCRPFDDGQPHDAIAFVQWLHGCDFREACYRLGGGDLPPATATRRQSEKKPDKPKAWCGDDWQVEAKDTVTRAVAVLDTDAGKAGRDYLEGRGLRAETWQAFRLGHDPAKWHSGWERKAGAVVMPWVIEGKYTAIKYRFLEVKDKADRFRAKGGSEQSLFGLPLVGGHRDTLILCEGELNAMSLWQAVHDLGRGDNVDAVSFGSESGAGDQALNLARKYRRVIVWADKGDIARDAARAMGAMGLKSPEGHDANDLLIAGVLAEFMALALERLVSEQPRKWKTVTLILPGDTPLGLPEGKWRRLENGEIEAIITPDELETALFVARAAEAA